MDDEDDFDELFAAFNDDPDIVELSERISNNLREQAGIGGNTIVHEGEADEGRVTWEAPEASGLGVADAEAAALQATRAANADSAAEQAASSLWDELAPEDESSGPAIAMSENITQAKAAAASMSTEELTATADLFDKLAAHGKGFAVIDAQEFQSLLLKLADDEAGKRLLRLLLNRRGR